MEAKIKLVYVLAVGILEQQAAGHPDKLKTTNFCNWEDLITERLACSLSGQKLILHVFFQIQRSLILQREINLSRDAIPNFAHEQFLLSCQEGQHLMATSNHFPFDSAYLASCASESSTGCRN